MTSSPRLPLNFDHLILGTPDLEATVRDLEEKLGVTANPGGSHPGRGTRNAILPLGEDRYLEILAPDPNQPEPEEPRWFHVDRLERARPVAWVAKGTDLARFHARAESKGVVLGKVQSGGRRNTEGVFLSWEATDPNRILGEGVVPFFIDWKDTPHPGRAETPQVSLSGFRGEHPDPETVLAVLRTLGLDLEVARGERPALIAEFRTPRGTVEIR